MKITKEDSVIDAITTKVSENFGWIQIACKNQGSGLLALQKARGIGINLINLAAREAGITLYDLSQNPLVLTTKDISSYRQLADLLSKYNHISRYDRNQIEADVIAVELKLRAAAKPKTVAPSGRRRALRGDPDTDLTGGYTADLFDVLDQYQSRKAPSVIPNSLFAVTPSASPAPAETVLPSAPTVHADEEIPRSFICPIIGKIMSDPVLFFRDGWTYEREAIASLLNDGQVSNLSQVGLEPGDILDNVLITNWALRAAINEFREKNPELFYGDIKSMTI